MSDGNAKEKAAISQIQKGNIQGLEYLVHAYQVEAIRSAYMVTRNLPLAEDVVQESFLHVYKRIGSFDNNRPFKPWFMHLVLNNAIKATNRYAKNISFKTLSNRDNLSPEEIMHNILPALEEQVSTKMLEDRIWEALDNLTPKQRAVIVAYYYLDMKGNEIATALNVPQGTVKWRLHSAKQQLKLLLTFK